MPALWPKSSLPHLKTYQPNNTDRRIIGILPQNITLSTPLLNRRSRPNCHSSVFGPAKFGSLGSNFKFKNKRGAAASILTRGGCSGLSFNSPVFKYEKPLGKWVISSKAGLKF